MRHTTQQTTHATAGGEASDAPAAADADADAHADPETSLDDPATPFDDAFHEECGVYGVIGVEEAANYAALGLHALQH
ncbi:MAG: hypothetical protein AAFZ09_05400, partial [Pseudomonadota bacterium]